MSDNFDDTKRRWGIAVRSSRAGDKAGALFVLAKLASEGVQQAYAELGKIYEAGGSGVEQDFREAVRWYRKAAYEARDVRGYLALGRMYYFGKGVPVDYGEAFRLYSLAVNNEKPIAYLMLARMFWLGRGIRKDSDKAKELYRQAARLGNLIALKELGFVERRTGHYWRGFRLGVSASLRIFFVAFRDANDPRLGRG